jgi:DNA-directed RNA polymerase subunit RPC12/RpoP
MTKQEQEHEQEYCRECENWVYHFKCRHCEKITTIGGSIEEKKKYHCIHCGKKFIATRSRVD